MPTENLFVIGVGPGAREYLTDKSKEIIQRSQVIAGFEPAIDIVRPLIPKGTQTVTLNYQNEEKGLRSVWENLKEGKRCCICCVGDPNFSDQQFIEKIKSICGQIEIVPGISSVQIACAKAGLAMEDILFITFHKFGPLEKEKVELLEAIRAGKPVILLPRPWDFMPKDISVFLMEKGISPELTTTIYENLTLPDERISESTLEDLLERDFTDLSIMVIGKDL